MFYSAGYWVDIVLSGASLAGYAYRESARIPNPRRTPSKRPGQILTHRLFIWETSIDSRALLGSNNIFERKTLEKRDALVYIVQLKNAFKILYKGYICNRFF